MPSTGPVGFSDLRQLDLPQRSSAARERKERDDGGVVVGVTLTFAVLGDSIAYGQGASRPADTVGARLAADLATSGTPTDVRVFAVPGADSRGLASQVHRATACAPGLALIIIGANDLTHFVPAPQAAALLGDAVRTLRAAGAEVVVAPAPDLSVVPWVPEQVRMVVQAGCRMLQQAQTEAALAAGARVADVGASSSAGFAADPAMFSSDRFHPSSAGYALIAGALAPTVRAAASAVRNRSTG
jgi:lysophospholipase L1-like esterase